MMRTLLKSAILVLALALPFTAWGQSNETLTLLLNEGSRIVGQSVTNSFTLQTSFGRLVIPWEDIERVNFLNTNGLASVDLNDGSSLLGKSVAKKIGINTAFGKLFIGVPLFLQIDVGARRFFGHVFSNDVPVVIPCDAFYSEQSRMPVTTLPQPITSCTWTFWIRTTQTQLATILTKDVNGPVAHDFFVNLNETAVGGHVGALFWAEGASPDAAYVPSTTIVNNGQWHHVAIVRKFDTKEIIFLIDGNAEPAVKNPNMWDINNNEPIYIGKFEEFCCPFKGEIRDMRFYPRALTGTQIQQVRTGTFPPSNGFIVLFDTTVTLPQ